MPPENRPRERLQQHGPTTLSTAELLAIIIKSGTKQQDIITLCNTLLSKYSLQQLSHCTLQELTQLHGIGPARASQILALFELNRRTTQTKKQTIKTPEDIASLYQKKLQHLQQEHLIALYLDTKNNIIKDQTITIGTINASLIHPREIFHGAIKNLAKSIVIIHNHPSGDPTPSESDITATHQIHEVGQLVNIPLIDHIIIGKNSYWSWQESLNT